MDRGRPNIIFIITDQQRYDTIAAQGFPHMDTPVLDRLAIEGASFSNCYVTGASCVPARASLFSGCYPHTTGVINNASGWRHSWVERFASAGYHCVSIGKMHTQPMDEPAGFHTRLVVENKDRSQAIRGREFEDEWDRELHQAGVEKPGKPTYQRLADYEERLGAYEWPLPGALHSDVFVGSRTVRWLEENPRREPLFLQIGFPGPHPPYDPPADCAAAYLAKDLPLEPRLSSLSTSSSLVIGAPLFVTCTTVLPSRLSVAENAMSVLPQSMQFWKNSRTSAHCQLQ